MKNNSLVRIIFAAGVLAVSAQAAHAQSLSFATQYGPSGIGQYNGPLFSGATVTYQLQNTYNGTSFSLGTGPGSDMPVLTYNQGVMGSYNNGQTGTSTDTSYLNHSYIYGGQPGSNAIELTLSGVAASDVVDFKFLNALPDDQAGDFTVTPLGGTASTPTTVSTTDDFTDIGSFTGATSYLITAISDTQYNTEISADLITIGAVPEPGTYACMALGGLLIGAMQIRRSKTAHA